MILVKTVIRDEFLLLFLLVTRDYFIVSSFMHNEIAMLVLDLGWNSVE